MLASFIPRCVLLCLVACAQLRAQDGPAATSLDEAPRLPGLVTLLGGFNAGMTAAGVHDSSVGWYNVVTPVMSYASSRHFAADLSMSIYPYRLTSVETTTKGVSSESLVFTGGDLGDMLAEVHATFQPGSLRNISTGSMTMPTGNRTDGLGTGKVTFNLDNRTELYLGRSLGRRFGQTGLLVDVGGGDSSGLANRLVTEDDSSLGPEAQFQAGFVTWLPESVSFQSVAYEQLPLGDQKTYTTYMRPGFPPMTVPTGRRVYEDNGFTNTLNVPLTAHVALTGSYNRSLRLHLDTVSVGLTFSLRGVPIRRRESLIDKAMREAERQAALYPLP